MAKSNNQDYHINYNWFIGLSMIILVSFLVGSVVSLVSNRVLNNQLAIAQEESRPANLELVVIADKNCPECYDPSGLIENIKAENVNITSLEILDASEDKATEMIKQLAVDKLPTLIVSGEIQKEPKLQELWSSLGDIHNNQFILRKVGAPYVEVASQEIRGKLNLTLLTDNSCQDCYEVGSHQQILMQYGAVSVQSTRLDINSPAGQKLADQYQIKLVPTIIIDGDIDVYPGIKQVWAQVGSIESDGVYVFRDGVKQMGVYKDLVSGQIINPASKQ